MYCAYKTLFENYGFRYFKTPLKFSRIFMSKHCIITLMHGSIQTSRLWPNICFHLKDKTPSLLSWLCWLQSNNQNYDQLVGIVWRLEKIRPCTVYSRKYDTNGITCSEKSHTQPKFDLLFPETKTKNVHFRDLVTTSTDSNYVKFILRIGGRLVFSNGN